MTEYITSIIQITLGVGITASYINKSEEIIYEGFIIYITVGFVMLQIIPTRWEVAATSFCVVQLGSMIIATMFGQIDFNVMFIFLNFFVLAAYCLSA